MRLWNLTIKDIISFDILLLVLSCKGMDLIKISALSESFALFFSFVSGFLLCLNFIKGGEFLTDLNKFNVSITIVHMMILREFARVSFPTKVTGINCLNGSIHLVRWNMIVVGVRSLVVSSFVYNDI